MWCIAICYDLLVIFFYYAFSSVQWWSAGKSCECNNLPAKSSCTFSIYTNCDINVHLQNICVSFEFCVTNKQQTKSPIQSTHTIFYISSTLFGFLIAATFFHKQFQWAHSFCWCKAEHGVMENMEMLLFCAFHCTMHQQCKMERENERERDSRTARKSEALLYKLKT